LHPFQIDQGSVLVIIGPNGSGKSTALREIDYHFTNAGMNGKVVKQTKWEAEGDEKDFEEWVIKNYSYYNCPFA
jgi:ABC-type cobalamin/Fe3+-siderophores transport system ATPase subunit